jgi:hypothetical protein
LKDLFGTLDLSLGTYRFSVSTMLPDVTKTAWSLKRKEILKEKPTASRKEFVFNINRATYQKEWGSNHERPGFGSRMLAYALRLMPRIGPFRSFGFKVPTPQTEKMFEDSFDAAIKRDGESYAQAKTGDLKIANRDLDTGKTVRPGEYVFTDTTYDKLVAKLAEKKFDGVTPALRANILSFYERMKTPDPHGIGPQLAALKATGSSIDKDLSK